MTDSHSVPRDAGHDPRDASDAIRMFVSFDVDQYSDLLCWVVDEDGKNAYRTHGVFAGTLHFDRASPLGFLVRGWGGDDLLSFQVVSATLITIPAAPTLPPSPLDGVAVSTFTMTGFPASDAPKKKGDRYFADVAGPTTIRVVDVDGGWHLRMVLTVQFTKASPSNPADQVTHTRTFYFDPESQVGNGTR